MKKLLRIAIAVCCLGFFVQAFAVSSPVTLLQSVSNKMISQLQKNRATLKTNPKLVYSLCRRYLLPHVDRTTMSQLVLGRNAWNSASKSERSAFIREFTTLVIRTYSAALAEYTNETVKFQPLRQDYKTESRVEVRSIIVRQSGPSIPVNYRMRRSGSSWKLYDLSVEGVSLVQSFRSQFGGILNQGGMSALLVKLKAHNRERQ